MITEKIDSTIYEKKHSNGILISYNMSSLGLGILTNIIGVRLMFFYETEIQLPISLMTLAIIFYTIWNMLNDPIIGQLSDRNNRFTRRWGKRFPWMICSIFPLSVVVIMMFIPPDPSGGVWATFFWFLMVLFLWDGFGSIYSVNSAALGPNKFRLTEERTKLAAITQVLNYLGVFLGLFISPFIIIYGNRGSYVNMALISSGLFLGIVVFSIPGIREEKELIDTYFRYEQKLEEPFLKTFFKTIKIAFKQKNFVAFVVVGVAIGLLQVLFIGSIPYYIKYVIKADPTAEIMLYIPFFIASIAPVPLFYFLCRKFGHLKIFTLAGILLSLVLIFSMFLSATLFMAIIVALMFGFFAGMFNVSVGPLLSDIFDECAVRNKKRQEGIYIGINTFFSRTVSVFQLFIFWIVHELTGFNPNVVEQTPLAQFGIIIQMTLIPGAAMLIGILIFLKIYDLKPKKVQEVKAQLKELGI